MTTTETAEQLIAGLTPEALVERLERLRYVPLNTYRLQFHGGFGFRDAQQLVPYLARLGITDCYVSPYLAANPGSRHGYDICDPNRLHPELGTVQEYAGWVRTLSAHQMGQVLDFVPNHMGADARTNQWWKDVLENGPCAAAARFFDIDWHPLKPELDGKVLLPILGDQYGVVLERGELRVTYEDGAFSVTYFDHRLPLNPQEIPRILRPAAAPLQAELGAEHPHLREYLSILTALSNLPPAVPPGALSAAHEPGRIAERQREKEVARERLKRLLEEAPRIRAHLEARLQALNGLVGDPRSFDELHELLEAQVYRLSYWKTAGHEVNYRRFFDINGLASLRMEEPAVFAATHGLVLQLVREGAIRGLRIDHSDGLFDPADYFMRLQAAILEQRVAALAGPLTETESERLRAWTASARAQDPAGVVARPFYVIAEKILSPGERLPSSWAIDGTTGYDALNDLNHLFVNPEQAGAMREVYQRFIGHPVRAADVVYDSKRLIMDSALASELNVLAHRLNRLSEEDRRSRDFTLNSLRDVLQEVVACFPVYRTYVSAAGWSAADVQAIDRAIALARRRNPVIEPSIFQFLRHAMLPQPDPDLAEEAHRHRLDFAMKLQQYTGPVTAKGLEDTAYYRHNLLLSLNEVGGHPSQFGCTVEQFHERMRLRCRHAPGSMVATSTHDTKRGEDARVRLDVLSELPEAWDQQLHLWARLNAGHRTQLDGEWAPDRNDEYHYYQALLGVWPAGLAGPAPAELIERISGYMLKAVKEAKVYTSWISDDPAYDQAVAQFVQRTLGGPGAEQFLAAFLPFQQRIARLGMLNSLSQLALKIASPGVVDAYQGAELWDLSLVDPDNRRAVDFAVRMAWLDEIERACARDLAGALRDLLAHAEDGRVKLYMTVRGLNFRKANRELLLRGEYHPVFPSVPTQQVCAFARRAGDAWLLVAVPRLVARAAPHASARWSLEAQEWFPAEDPLWKANALQLPPDAPVRWRHVLTGDTHEARSSGAGSALPLAPLFARWPAALLEAV